AGGARSNRGGEGRSQRRERFHCSRSAASGAWPAMSTFSRYLLRQVAAALLLILLSLSGVVWIALALRELDLVTSQGQDTWVLFIMTTLAVPNLIGLIAPIALLIATIHTLNRLNGDS